LLENPSRRENAGGKNFSAFRPCPRGRSAFWENCLLRRKPGEGGLKFCPGNLHVLPLKWEDVLTRVLTRKGEPERVGVKQVKDPSLITFTKKGENSEREFFLLGIRAGGKNGKSTNTEPENHSRKKKKGEQKNYLFKHKRGKDCAREKKRRKGKKVQGRMGSTHRKKGFGPECKKKKEKLFSVSQKKRKGGSWSRKRGTF